MSSKSPDSRSNERERFARMFKQYAPEFLSDPWNFPDEMKSYLLGYVAQNIPQIPFSQIVGFPHFRARMDEITTAESTTSSDYVDLTTEGPEIAGLSNGQYVVQFGAYAETTSNVSLRVSISINGSVPTFAHSAELDGPGGASISQQVAVTLDGGNSNSIKLQYKTVTAGLAGTFGRRWLTVFRSGN